ncbi:MAG: hypothetical protein IJC10_05480 [Clostridia bacterium]|nr:hypothetical protein [Clostridia bacterium]
MNKKRLFIVVVSAIVFALVVGFLYMQFGHERLEKTVSIQGYEITVPGKWSSDSKGILYDSKGNTAGEFTLINEDKAMVGKEIAENVIKCETQHNSKNAIVYYIKNLPNPEPYGVSFLFYKETVSERMCQKIYESFKIPAIGTNPPEKNIEATELSQIQGDKVCRVEFADGMVTVKNIKLINTFIDRQRDKQSTGIDIVDYKEEEGRFLLTSWYHLESDRGAGYMYTYYKKDDGTYTYNNNPLTFEAVTKEMSEKKSTTSYRLTSGGVKTTTILEIPLNFYRDNAEELIALKTMNATELEIQKILDKIKTKDELNALTFKVSSNALLITHDEGIKSERSKAYSDAAVLFSLASNLDSITFVYNDGKEYTFTRAQIEKTLDTDMDSASENKENFVDLAEKIENSQQSQMTDGAVVYSGTVTVSYNTIVTHPKTGERVEVGPYAEKKGYGQYLGKLIYCEIRRMGSAYIASASYGGNVIGSYPLNSEAELQNAINLIKAYS